MYKLSRKLAVPFVATPLLVAGMLGTAPARTGAEDFDAAAYFATAKCAMCHTAKAEKHFDATKADEVLVDAVLKGVNAEKPPAMPSYEGKGLTADQAKALVAYMKTLKA